MPRRVQAVDSRARPVGVPRTGNGAVRRVPPARSTNASVRNREHLTQGEVEQLIEAARATRNGVRDATMILLAYRHLAGPQVGEHAGICVVESHDGLKSPVTRQQQRLTGCPFRVGDIHAVDVHVVELTTVCLDQSQVPRH
jgi:hypothetical protein